MSQLFSKSAIRQAISSFEGLNIDKEIAIVQELYTDFRNGNMKDETRYEQRFNDLFFGQLLDYESGKHRIPQAPIPVGQKRADVALGFFEDNKYTFESVKVMVEFKGSDTLLDKKQASYGGQSPVDQGFGYKTSFKDCPWLIVSNFASVRLYRDNKQDFEIWTIEELANPDNDYYQLKTLLGLLKRNHLISQSGTSFSEKLLSEVRIKQKQITKDFYKQYKKLRFELINDIRHHNPEIHVETVVEKAQKIIDRIVFVHFCEDKGLLPEGKFAEVVKYGEKAMNPTFQTLINFFEAVNSGSDRLEIPDGYNGGLFHEDKELNNLKIGDIICRKFVDLGNYSFDDELSVNILGHIFEQSISDIEQLKGRLLGEEITTDELVEKKGSKRNEDGIFYTPEYIVDYIVQNSLMVYLEEKENECLAKHKKDEKKAYETYKHILENVKVLDPACGSGAFLVKVFDYLYKENEKVGDILKQYGAIFSVDEVYKSILRNNIYGVDLNPESVEITKLSLWLKSAQKGKKLNNLDENIKCGNSLIDDPAVAGDRAFDWQKEFADIMGAGGFDVIVGNPPYVPTEYLSEIDKRYLENAYDSAFGRINLYPIFYEQALKLLKKESIIGFITPYTILKNQYYKAARKYILDNSQILEIIDFKGVLIFQDAAVDSIILILKKGIYKNYIFKQIEKIRNFEGQIYESNFFKINEILTNSDLSMLISKNDNIINRLRKETIPLKEIINFNQGIITGSNKDYLTNNVGINTKKVLTGSDFNKYYISYKGGLIKYDINHLHRPRKKEIFEVGEKILLRQTGGYPICTIDTDSFYTLDTVHNGLLINQKFNIKYLLTLLNSKLIKFIYESQINEVGKVFAQVKIIYIDPLPIKSITLSDQQPFIEKADFMLSLNKELHDKTDSFLRYISSKFGLEKLSTKLQKLYDYDFATFLKELKFKKLSMSEEAELMEFFENKKSEIVALKNQIDTTDREIDEMVFELYGLSDEERAVVLDS